MDHLSPLLKSVFPDSKIAAGISCGRTKMSSLVKNVTGKESFQILCNKLKTRKFALIVDESTDRSCAKHLSLVVRYIDDDFSVRDDFFYLVKVSVADAQTLYEHIVNCFVSNSIPYKENMIGFASDGANVMMGEHNSVQSRLKTDIPFLFVVKCICHSFHLCASYACEKLPRYVEDLTRDVYNYFNSSPKRTVEFEQFQHFCNIKIHKILHPSQTRWLSVHMVVTRILEQYDALKLYFIDSVSNHDVLAAENILNKLNDPTCKLFLLFLDFSLPWFTKLNKEMQSEHPKIHVVYNRICSIIRTIFDCFIKPEYIKNTALENINFKDPSNYLPIERMYFGARVEKTLLETNITKEIVNFFKLRCFMCKVVAKYLPGSR